MQQVVHRRILGIDIQRFSSVARTDQTRARLRARLYRLLNQALVRAGIDQSQIDLSDVGDGLLLLAGGEVSTSRLLQLVVMLAVDLRDDNRQVPSAERMRLRVAVHSAEVARDARGIFGESVIYAARILDAKVGRAILTDAPDADLVLLVSDQVYQNVVRHHYEGIDPATYQPVWVRNKETRTRAWAHVPNQPVRPGPAHIDAAVIEQPRIADLDEDGLWIRGRTRPGDITVIGDVVDGREYVLPGNLARHAPIAEAPIAEALTRVGPLPPDAAGFTGREEVGHHLRNWLMRVGDGLDGTQVCVISGIGGVGKSALAIHVAHQVASEFPDGQLYVNLSGRDGKHRDLGGLLAELLRTLGVSDEAMPKSREGRASLYQALLAERRMLLVLDAAERVADVRQLLPGKGACMMLVTTRTSMAALGRAAHISLATLDEREAVALLRSFADQEDLPEAAAVRLAELCGHLPLALRIASASLTARAGLTADALIGELAEAQQRWERSSGQAVAPLDEMVTASIALSYSALDAGEARILRLLGLHDGSEFGAESVAALSGTSLAATQASLRSLAESGLIQPSSTSGRYRLHDIARAFARLRLEAEEPKGEQRRALTRLVGWYLSTAAAAAERLQPDWDRGRRHRENFSSREAALAWLDIERANLTSIIEQAAAVEMTASLPQLAGHLFAYYTLRGQWQDAERTYEQALRAARGLGDRLAEARLLNNLAIAFREQRRFEDSTTCLEQSLAICRATRDRQGERLELTNLGVVYREQQDLDSALACLQEGLRIAREVQDHRGEGHALANLGNVYRDQGRLVEAMAHYQLSLAVAREVGDRSSEAVALSNLGVVAERMGDLLNAIDCFSQSLAIHGTIGDWFESAAVHAELGTVYSMMGDVSPAREHYEQSLEAARGFSAPQSQARAMSGLASLDERAGDLDSAVAHYTQAVELARSAGDRWVEARVCASLATVSGELGEPYQALTWYERGLEAARDIGDKPREAATLVALADACARAGQLERAVSCYEYGLGILRDLGDRSGEARALEQLAGLHRQAGRVAEAEACVRRTSILRGVEAGLHPGGGGSMPEADR